MMMKTKARGSLGGLGQVEGVQSQACDRTAPRRSDWSGVGYFWVRMVRHHRCVAVRTT